MGSNDIKNTNRGVLAIAGIGFLLALFAIVQYLSSPTTQNDSTTLERQLLAQDTTFMQQVGSGIVFYDLNLHRFRTYENGDFTDLAQTSQPIEVTFDPKGKLAAIKVVSGDTLQWQVIDLVTGNQLGLLDPRISRLVFSQVDDRILYEFQDDSIHNLTIADSSGNNWVAIQKLVDNVIDIRWLRSNTFALYLAGNATPSYTLLGLSSKQTSSLDLTSNGNIDQPISRESRSGQFVVVNNTVDSTVNSTLLRFGSNGLESAVSLNTQLPSQFCTWDYVEDLLYCIERTLSDAFQLSKINPVDLQREIRVSSSQFNAAFLANESAEGLQLICVINETLYFEIRGNLYSLLL